MGLSDNIGAQPWQAKAFPVLALGCKADYLGKIAARFSKNKTYGETHTCSV